MTRRAFITLLGGAAAWPLAARAQQRERMRRIGIVMPFAKGDSEGEARIHAFKQELAKLGWTDGSNVQFDERWPADNMDMVRSHAASVVASNPDVIVTFGGRVVPVFMRLSDPDGAALRERSGRRRLCAKPGASGRQCHRLYQFRALDARQVPRNIEADCARDRSRGTDLQPGQSQHRLLSAHLSRRVRSARSRGHRPPYSYPCRYRSCS